MASAKAPWCPLRRNPMKANKVGVACAANTLVTPVLKTVPKPDGDVSAIAQAASSANDPASIATPPKAEAKRSSQPTNKAALLQDPFLNTLRRERVPVNIYLVNGIKLQGRIDSFDQYVIMLANTVTQMVYKHAISTIVPGRAIDFNPPQTGDD